MTTDGFWERIDEARQASSRLVEMPQRLIEVLCRADEAEIIAYETFFRECMCRAYDAKLWLAAELIMDGCGDDTFSDFRCWLIAQGRSAFESATADPDTMANLDRFDGDDGYPTLFYFGSVASHAFFKRLGVDRRDFATGERFEGLLPPWNRPDLKHPEFLDATDGDARMLFPRLAARFPRGIRSQGVK